MCADIHTHFTQLNASVVADGGAPARAIEGHVQVCGAPHGTHVPRHPTAPMHQRGIDMAPLACLDMLLLVGKSAQQELI